MSCLLSQNNCPCNGTWAPGIARSFTTCPPDTCDLTSQGFTHGIPVGTTLPGYGTLLNFNNFFFTITHFSPMPNYKVGFDVTDHNYMSIGTSESMPWLGSRLCGCVRGVGLTWAAFSMRASQMLFCLWCAGNEWYG